MYTSESLTNLGFFGNKKSKIPKNLVKTQDLLEIAKRRRH